MFSKVLIANRGEIACRVIETCRRLGVGTVAVYSDADARARHVELADEAVRIGPAPVGESYLNGARLIEAALASGAGAIHPGYGFLSEAPDFVDAVDAAGLVFVGPSADAIRAMGLKDAAKALMERAGVPVVPGYHGAEQEAGFLAEQAESIGYPVLIKAVAGGGGKGMRRVDAPGAFAVALERARSEAQSAFGNGDVLIEKFVSAPRHIEVQVFGDGARAVHLFERDCSLQRRHQKVIEEAPAPGMTDEMRAAMTGAAVRAAEAIGYRGAGTVEFIVDGRDGLRPDGFWFMEMNTRLQVEHPVTEAVTGIDLVEWQLRVAAGEPLPASQEDIALTGHAFEARVYAEDPATGFLPATGRLEHLVFPSDARVDTGVREGDEVTPFYDPMIAKITTQGPTRALALSQLYSAISRTEAAGTVTNLAFLRRLAGYEAFVAGRIDTGLIDRDVDALTPVPVPCNRTRALAALGVLELDARSDALEGFSLWEPLVWDARFRFGSEDISARVAVAGPGAFSVTVGGETLDVARDGAGWVIDGTRVSARVVRHRAGVSVFWGNGYHFTTWSREVAGTAAATGDIRAPMPGQVLVVNVAPGEQVEAGAPLAVLEAMKMEHVLRAPSDGVVAEVLVNAGSQVDGNALLVRMDVADAGETS